MDTDLKVAEDEKEKNTDLQVAKDGGILSSR
jgi:hypothetical protein